MLVTSKPCTVMYSEFFSRMVSLTPAPAMMGAAPSPYAPMVWGALVQVVPALNSRDSPALRVMPFAAVNELNEAGLASAS